MFNLLFTRNVMKKKENDQKKEEEEIEKILDSTWDNWSSRRKCEKTHVPDYIKRQEE